MQRLKPVLPAALGLLALALAPATGWSQFAVNTSRNHATPNAELDEGAWTSDPYSALWVGKVSTTQRPDVLALQDGDLALWVSPGRYHYAHHFGPACSGAALVPSSNAGRSAVLTAQSTGLVSYECSHAAIGTGVAITSSSLWAGASALDTLEVGGNTWIAGRTPAQKLLFARLSSGALVSAGSYLPGATISDLCALDWNGDGTPEFALMTSIGLAVVDASGTLILFVPGTNVPGRVARLPRGTRDDLLFVGRDPTLGWSYLYTIHGVVTGTNIPIYDPPVAAPCETVTDLVVADYDGDGHDDAILADADSSEYVRAWVMHQIAGGGGSTPSFEIETSTAGRRNHLAFCEGASPAPLRLAVGDYDTDGDVDLAGGYIRPTETDAIVRTVDLMPSITVAEATKRPRFVGYLAELEAPVAGWRDCTYEFAVGIPTLASNPLGLDELQVAIWWQAPPGAGGAVAAVATETHYEPITSGVFGTQIEFSTGTFQRPESAEVVQQIQFTLVKRTAGVVVATGPSLTAYNNPSLSASGGVTLDQPDELPGGSTQNPNIRPPSNPPTP